MVICPKCAADLTPAADGMVTCSCGLNVYAGYVQEYDYLTRRLAWLRDRIEEDAPAPDAATARVHGVWQSGVSGVTPHKESSIQLLLVTLGAGLLIFAALVFVAVTWAAIGPWGQLSLLSLVTVALAVSAVLARRPAHRTAEALAAVSFCMGLIVSTAAPALGALPSSWNDQIHPYRFIVFTLAFVIAVGLGRHFGLRAWSWLGWLMLPSVAVTALGLGSRWVSDDEAGITVSALVLLGVGLAVLVAATDPDTWPMRLAGLVCLTMTVALTVAACTFDPPLGAVLIVAVMLVTLVLLRERLGPWAEYMGWPLLGFWLALLALLLPVSPWVSGLVAIVAVALALAIAGRGIAVSVVAAATLVTTYALGSSFEAFDVLTLVAGIGCYGLSLRRGAAPVAWFGAALVETAFLLQTGDRPFFEVNTLVLAVLLLVAGLITRRAGSSDSGVIYGPAVLAALVPSAILSWSDVWSQTALIRFAVVVVFGVALLVVGVRLKMLGLVIPSAIAVTIAAAAQVFATLDLLPRWVGLAVAGAILISIGARLEWVRDRGKDTENWLLSLK